MKHNLTEVFLKLQDWNEMLCIPDLSNNETNKKVIQTIFRSGFSFCGAIYNKERKMSENQSIPNSISETNQTFCKLDNPTISNLFTSVSNVVWYASENATTPLNSTDLLIDGSAYWASQFNSTTTCESLLRTKVNVTLTETLPVITIVTNLQFCIDENATIKSLNAIENNLQWFANSTFDSPLNTSELLINGKDYWAKKINTSSNCQGSTIYQVTISIQNLSAPTTEKTNQAFCIDENATIFNLQANGENIKWYN